MVRKLVVVMAVFMFMMPGGSFGQEGLGILLINDDGIDARGLHTLKERLEEAGHTVTVVAPSGNASASSSATNLGGTFLIEPYDKGDAIENEYSVSRTTFQQEAIDPVPGTPADCLIASASILDSAPDLIISGINDQHNTGKAVQFSGTVGGALSATSKLSPYDKVPSISVNLEGIFFSDPDEASADFEKVFDDAADFTVNLIKRLQESAVSGGGGLLPQGITLNVNYPARPLEEIKGVRYRRQGDTYLVRFDDGTGEYPVRSIRSVPEVLSQDESGAMEIQSVVTIIDANETARRADTEDLVDGYITIVPLDGDYTARSGDRGNVRRRIGALNSLLHED